MRPPWTSDGFLRTSLSAGTNVRRPPVPSTNCLGLRAAENHLRDGGGPHYDAENAEVRGSQGGPKGHSLEDTCSLRGLSRRESVPEALAGETCPRPSVPWLPDPSRPPSRGISGTSSLSAAAGGRAPNTCGSRAAAAPRDAAPGGEGRSALCDVITSRGRGDGTRRAGRRLARLRVGAAAAAPGLLSRLLAAPISPHPHARGAGELTEGVGGGGRFLPGPTRVPALPACPPRRGHAAEGARRAALSSARRDPSCGARRVPSAVGGHFLLLPPGFSWAGT